MIGLQVKFVNEEVLVRLEKLPAAVQDLVAERMRPLMEALREKVLEGVERKFQKSYPEMFVSGVDRIGSLTIGFVEFQPSDKSYWIRVGSKGLLANRETGFLSKHDVLHPALRAASVAREVTSAYTAMREIIVAELEDVVHEAIYAA